MTWSVINEVIGRNNDKLSPVDCFKIKNSDVIAEEFWALFTNVGKNMPVRYLMLSINIVIICVTQIKTRIGVFDRMVYRLAIVMPPPPPL